MKWGENWGGLVCPHHQRPARLELNASLRGDRYRLTGLRIAAYAWSTSDDLEAAKVADLDATAGQECRGDRYKDEIYRFLHVTGRKVLQPISQYGNKFGLGHPQMLAEWLIGKIDCSIQGRSLGNRITA